MAPNNVEDIRNGFEFRYITPSDYAEVLAHLEASFYIEEPVNKLLGTSVERVADQNVRYTDMLNRYPKSLFTRSTGTSNEIAGVLITHIHDKNNPLPTFNPRSSITTKFLHFLDQAESKCNIFGEFNVASFPELAILSIDKQHRGKGLATELFRKSIEQLFSDGFPLIYSEFSNPASQKIGKNLGFREVARFAFKEYKNEDGLYPYDEEDGFVSMMVLEKNNFAHVNE